MLRIGIVGLGVIFATHLEAIGRLKEKAALVAVCDCNPRKKSTVPEIPFYEELETMLREEHLDCLHVCLPHHLHLWAAELGARYHTNVFLEKPAGLTVKEIEVLEEKTKDIVLGVCLQNRYNATTKKVMELIQNQTYGKLRGCKAIVTWDRRGNYYDKDPWRGELLKAGGGVMLSQAIHTMDLLGLFCGEVKWVKGLAGNLLLEDIEVEDTACAHIAFKSGAGAVFYGSVTHCSNSSIELEVILEEAVLSIKNNRLLLLKDHKETEIAADDIQKSGKDYYGYSHYNAISEFYKELTKEGGSHISVAEAMRVSQMIEGIMKSSQTGQRVYIEGEV